METRYKARDKNGGFLVRRDKLNGEIYSISKQWNEVFGEFWDKRFEIRW